MKLNFKDKVFFKRRSAFTLIELLLSLGIIVLISVFTIPGFNEYAKRKRFELAVTTFAADISNIRSKALAGVRPSDPNEPVYDGDLLGIFYYCTSSTSDPFTGDYYLLYRHPDGVTHVEGSYNLDRVDDGVLNAKPKYRFECPGNPSFEGRFIYFEKYTGLGAISYGEFMTSNVATVTIVMDATGWREDVAIYKTGVINVL